MTDEQTTCPRCGAPLNLFQHPDGHMPMGQQYECGNPSPACDHAASLRRECDEARLAVRHVTGVISEMQDEIDEARKALALAADAGGEA